MTLEKTALDSGFQEEVRWMQNKLGIPNPEHIRVTVVIDGEPYRSSLSAEQLLQHNLGSVFQLSGVIDLFEAHSVHLLVRIYTLSKVFEYVWGATSVRCTLPNALRPSSVVCRHNLRLVLQLKKRQQTRKW